MRCRLAAMALVSQVACGPSEVQFQARYEENFCAALVACGSLNTCDDATTSGTIAATDNTPDCDFDAGQARACLDATWECDRAQNPLIPADCGTVYPCAGST